MRVLNTAIKRFHLQMYASVP